MKLLVILAMVTSSASGADRQFHLDEVSSIFPWKEFEHEVAFWKSVFAQYESREIIFHDQNDLRLVYYHQTFPSGIEGNPSEARRQRKILKNTTKKVQSLFDDIAQHGTTSDRLTGEHRKIIKVLEDADYKITSSLLRRLRDNMRYQRGVRDKFMAGLIRSGRYVDQIEEVFTHYGLPTELAALPHVESSFNYNAYSKAGAAGIWQFTRGTGRSYLKINRYIDERLDPIEATEAAAKLFRDNHTLLESWPLTVTSYNHGRNGMRRAKSQYGDDLRMIVDNYRSKYFGFASRNFYAEFLAALDVSRNSEYYFGPLVLEDPLEYDSIPLDRAYDPSYFTTVPGLSQEVLSDYNPHLRRIFASHSRVVPAGIHVRVPQGMGGSLQSALESARPSSAKLMVASDGSIRYRIQHGDALGEIASQFGTSTGYLQRLNGISNPNRIYPGQVLLVSKPTESTVAAAPAAPSEPEPVSPSVQAAADPAPPARYEVRRGDNLAVIARRFDTTVRDIQSANALSNPNRIHPGMELVIPGSGQALPTNHVVRRGDTLEKIARLYGSSVSEIQQVNNIRNPNQIRRGQKLLIP
ncbi:MAG: LysM peptidoglycan-binding domain-containing protein [Acidobacteriota bacterium]|nr:MAG: LysM peptidoglycan-binding domain-containing protein [Acidobacteriota bacterium]